MEVLIHFIAAFALVMLVYDMVRKAYLGMSKVRNRPLKRRHSSQKL